MPAGRQKREEREGAVLSLVGKAPGERGERRQGGKALLSSFSFFSLFFLFFFLVSSCSQWVLDKVVWFTPTPYPSQQGSLDVPLTHDDYTTQQGGVRGV